MEGVASVLSDPAFSLPSQPASTTRKLAEHLSVWIPEHLEEARAFETELTRLLSECLKVGRARTQRAKRERMWSAYHTLRVSDTYRSEWNTFIISSGSTTSSFFCQHVGHYVFKQLVQRNHTLTETQQSSEPHFVPTYEEKNGIRYAAGWVTRALKKKLPKSSLPQRKDLQLCLWDLLDDGDEGAHESKEWVEMVDRGGLCRVNNLTYEVFLMMEKTLRNIVGSRAVPCIPADCTERIKKDEDVQFVWCMMCSEWEKQSADILLEMIVNEWTKIRGFSYASAWVEQYKSEQRKTIQKTKGVRKQLMGMPQQKKARTDHD